MTLSKAVAMRLSNLLMNKNMTYYRFMKTTGMQPSTFYGFMREKTTDIKLSTVNIICSAFDMSIREFFNDKLFDRENLDN